VTDDNVDAIKNKLDPKGEMFFIWSIDYNPDWDKQELMWSFMERIHLG
jgi:hypothetical protein